MKSLVASGAAAILSGMATLVKAALHRGFILRAPDGTVIYDDEADARYGSDAAVVARAQEVHDHRFPHVEVDVEPVVRYGINLVNRDTPTVIIYSAIDDEWSPADAYAEGKRVARLIDAGTHRPVRDADGSWRLELVPEED